MQKHGIGFVATGSELVYGGVLNTSSPSMANRLFDKGFAINTHWVVSDDQASIAKAISQGMDQCEVLVISGGLGPTSDDRTRFALADVLGIRLVFYDSVWQSIEGRFQLLRLPIPENNRNQAFFPPQSTILENKQGSAAGCYIKANDTHIFMLPGPPNECLPMFEHSVMPIVKGLLTGKWLFRQHWFLLGTSEGSIAALCDPLMEKEAKKGIVELGYRVQYPYLELKLFAQDEAHLAHFGSAIDDLVKDVSVGKDTASHQLKEQLIKLPYSFALNDTATGERLLTRLLYPETAHAFKRDANIKIAVTGMESFWRGEMFSTHPIGLRIEENGKERLKLARDIPHRGLLSLELAAEWVCLEWLRFLLAYPKVCC